MIRLLLLLSLLLIPVQGFVTYVQNGVVFRWNLPTGVYHTNLVNPVTKKIRYQLAQDAYSPANAAAELNAMRACFDQWASIPGTSLGFEEGPLAPAGGNLNFDNTNLVFFAKSSLRFGDRIDISGRRGFTAAHYFSDNIIREADIVLNAVQFQWFTDFDNTVNQAQFIESVLLHEIGHFIGLDHSPAGGATLANGAGGIGTQAGLSADEIAAARFLYPKAGFVFSTIKGRVTMNGTGVFGAIVAAEDSSGNVAGTTVTRTTGDYEIPALAAGRYKLRVSPFDPKNEPNSSSLLRAEEIAWDYVNATTAFYPTPDLEVTIGSGETRTQNFTVAAGGPAFRITSISKPTSWPDLVTIERFATQISPGARDQYLGVNGPNLPRDGVLRISGDGIIVGQSVFKENRFPGLHSIVAPITVATNATPGLRTFVLTSGTNVAYAHGYLEVLGPFPDFNFDGLDDRFQRRHFPRFTAPQAAPGADPDQDGFSNEFEFRTGSNPVDSTSYNFLIESVKTTSTNSIVRFKSEVGKKYRILARNAMEPGATWYAASNDLIAEGPVTEAVLAHGRFGAGTHRFFRLLLLP